MHNVISVVQFGDSFLLKSLRNSKKMCYFAPDFKEDINY